MAVSLMGIGRTLLSASSKEELLLAGLIEKKLEDAGRDLLMSYLPSDAGIGHRVQQAITTGGMSEFTRARDQFLNQFKPSALPGTGFAKRVGRFAGQFSARASRFRRRGFHARAGTWQASSWATSRDDWLDNAWRHDWRSQPRDVRGRWVPGRLDYIATQLQYRGRKKGRTVLRRRKIRRLRRIATKREIKRLLSKR